MMRLVGSGHALASGPGGRRGPTPVLLVVALAALLVVTIVVAGRPEPTGTVGRAVTATSAAPSSEPSRTAADAEAVASLAREAARVTAEQALDAAADAAVRRELEQVAATLDGPVALSSPTAWDQWLPEGKPFPGASTEEDMATCPRLTDRLEAVLGTGMSYWTGTLPQGPSGCTWATVPLSYGPDPYDYPYLASVGFLADGTTTEQLSRSFFHHQGQICPSVAVPAAGEGAHLVRCEEMAGTTYVLVTRDVRTTGVWVLDVHARADADHPAVDLLAPVLDGVAATFG